MQTGERIKITGQMNKTGEIVFVSKYIVVVRINGINEFAKETASNLLKKYPDIDFYDLMFQFEMQFRHEYLKAMLKETSD